MLGRRLRETLLVSVVLTAILAGCSSFTAEHARRTPVEEQAHPTSIAPPAPTVAVTVPPAPALSTATGPRIVPPSEAGPTATVDHAMTDTPPSLPAGADAPPAMALVDQPSTSAPDDGSKAPPLVLAAESNTPASPPPSEPAEPDTAGVLGADEATPRQVLAPTPEDPELAVSPPAITAEVHTPGDPDPPLSLVPQPTPAPPVALSTPPAFAAAVSTAPPPPTPSPVTPTPTPTPTSRAATPTPAPAGSPNPTATPPGTASVATASTPTPTPVPVTSAAPRMRAAPLTPGTYALVVAQGDCLRVRDVASLAGAIIGCVPSGSIVSVSAGATEADGYRWQKIASGKLTGWAVDVYLEPSTTPPSAAPAAPSAARVLTSDALRAALELSPWPRSLWPTVERIVRCESSNNLDAVGPLGHRGLMQVAPWLHGPVPGDAIGQLAQGYQVYLKQGWKAWACY